MNPSLIAMFIVVLAGGATALQAPTNARLAGAVASPVNAAFISFAVGTVVLGVVGALVLKDRMAAYISIMSVPLPAALAYAGQQLMSGLILLGVALALFAAIDTAAANAGVGKLARNVLAVAGKS